MCSLRGNATEWETATGNNSFFHRALAGTGHFSAEFAAVVIMSRLRADKLIQKCRLSERRPICRFYWNTFIERIFQCALPKVHSFSLFRKKPEQQGEVHALLFKSSTFFSQNIFFWPFPIPAESFLGHFSPHPWLFCQSSVLSLALVLQNFSLSVTFIQVEFLPLDL